MEPPKKIRTVVVDDEPLARTNISVMLKHDPEIEIVRECGSGMEALAEIRNTKPDLVFLDVQMPECDGFDVLALLGTDLPPAIVFVTAYDQYALRAFEAADYYACLHVGTRTHLLRRSMAELEQELDQAVFCRIHRSTIVNLDRVRGLKLGVDGEYEALLDNGTRLRLSRRYRKQLQSRLGVPG